MIPGWQFKTDRLRADALSRAGRDGHSKLIYGWHVWLTVTTPVNGLRCWTLTAQRSDFLKLKIRAIQDSAWGRLEDVAARLGAPPRLLNHERSGLRGRPLGWTWIEEVGSGQVAWAPPAPAEAST